MTMKQKAFENIFSRNFSTHPNKSFCFKVKLIMSSTNAFSLDQSKILSFGKELKVRIV